MIVHGDRIYIRPLDLPDVPALHLLRAENESFFRPFEPLQDSNAFTLDAVRESLVKTIAEREQDSAYAFGIFLNGTDELIGRVRLSSIVRGPWQNANLGYYISERFNGQGYMSEAVGLALRFAFESCGLHRVQAAIMPRNRGSIRVAEKNAMRLEGLARNYLQIHGVWEDHAIYAMTREEWPPAAGDRADSVLSHPE
ncbi:GNAT family N-acetyltransferase [Paenibacillus ehimensis]|uniref:GNAT family protein n=1 Tax=Paenibacillus ehimensis TaxID=79264 RepID=A0ABT8V8G2_9BACL|nr:GNAT family protein [Paenibacillus ehimensis]MDO3677745.1 GNAT family protein [Paenibacillus ehimensis]MEC0212381.1 GNAT family protein [Paenibacillus ehimensis]